MNAAALLMVPLALILAGGRRKSAGAAAGNYVLLPDEQRGGQHYGGEYPIDSAHEIRCRVCGATDWAKVRFADWPREYRGKTRFEAVTWFRVPDGWTLMLPHRANDDGPRLLGWDVIEAYRCPKHQLPPVRKVGPPPAPHQLVKPGWYWYWVKPAEQAEWDELRARWLYVLYLRESWGQHGVLGSIELFEVVGDDVIWTLQARPRPAPKGANTTLLDIISSDPNPVAGWAQDELAKEFERLRNPPPREPFPWLW